jgi:hypothetical protein
VPELEIQERLPPKVRNIDDGPREVPELEVQERPPSTLRNVDGRPPGGAGDGDPKAQCHRSPPLGQGDE